MRFSALLQFSFLLFLSIGPAFGIHVDRNLKTGSTHICSEYCSPEKTCEEENDPSSCRDELILDHFFDRGVLFCIVKQSEKLVDNIDPLFASFLSTPSLASWQTNINIAILYIQYSNLIPNSTSRTQTLSPRAPPYV